ncbi:hypothetical protein CCACVL1_07888 [Corchorus capsularis]|uniref:Uncharacterized protein n=1 Tax=Corchorus capsularis TaxID=210143 RepID=A0A1R3J3F0_COCAP|nr:hypothetical protein CCACVL1_07888 [Corchorus capsularis]
MTRSKKMSPKPDSKTYQCHKSFKTNSVEEEDENSSGGDWDGNSDSDFGN